MKDASLKSAALLCVLGLTGCGVGASGPVSPTPTASITALPAFFAVSGVPGTFQPAQCPFVLPQDMRQGEDVECGYLTVKEERGSEGDAPQGRVLQLAVAIFHPPSGVTHPDPVVFLSGGPGASALEPMRYQYEALSEPVFATGRDLVVFDQRGTGFSQPRLACNIAADYAGSLAQDERLSELAWEAARMPACQQELEAQGIHLSAYTTLASAADLHDLILALGYEQVNLFGQSYGTNLALTYLDEYGAQGKLRSLVLDGVAPPETDLFAERGRNAQGAFQAIFEACAADPACSKAFPDAEQRFYSLLEHMAADPITLTADETGRQPVVVNDHRLLEALYRTAYFSDRIPNIPAMLAGFEGGDYRLFRKALDDMLASATSVDSGVYYAIRCSDQSRLPTAPADSLELSPALQDYFRTTEQAMRRFCANLGDGRQVEQVHPALDRATPVLLLSGAFDPATPPALAEMVAKRLANAFHYTSPTGSHDQLAVDTCAQTITTRFVQDLTPPDDPCLEQEVRPYFFTGGGN